MHDVIESSSDHANYTIRKNTSSEVKLFFSTLFVGYKHFISSQDGSSCSFTPSCSVYMKEAVQKQGIIVGLMNGFDRLTRCNNLEREHYEYNREQQLLEDPITRDPFLQPSSND